MASDSNQLPLPPAPPAHWLWGHAKMMFNNPLQFSADCASDYFPVCRLRFVYRSIFITADIDCARQIFLTETDNFWKGKNYQILSLIAGKGLITSEGDFWKRQRRLAQPGFHKEKLRGFVQTFIDSSYELAEKWEQYNPDECRSISAEMSELTLRIIGKTLFSQDLFDESSSVPPDVKQVLRFLNKRNYAFPRYPISWPLPSHKAYARQKKRLDDVVFKIIDERIQGITQGEDLLQLFLEATDAETGEKMNRVDIRDEIMTMFLAGFETSSVALTWTLYLISQHPEVREKFLKELQLITGEDKVRPEHIMQLTYTRQILEEAMRLFPPVFTIPRQLMHAMDMKGYRLPKGSLVLTSIYAIHRSPRYWQEPEKFDPDRFSPENADKIEKGAYMPFGLGQRMCIGNQFALLEMVSALAVLGRKYELFPKEGYVPEMIPAITTNVSEGMPMYIRKIQSR